MLIQIPTSFVTERLTVRSYRLQDAELFYAACRKNRTHLARFESGNLMMAVSTFKEACETIQEVIRGWEAQRYFFWGMFEKSSGAWIGQVYLGWVNRELPELEIGYVADQDYEGRGYVSEAVKGVLKILLDDLGIQRVSLRCSDANDRSMRVAERCGFTYEGHLRQNHLAPDGSVEGDMIYGLLQADYYKTNEAL
jgi:RimJ/RimL family protein N-acetyltransferase